MSMETNIKLRQKVNCLGIKISEKLNWKKILFLNQLVKIQVEEPSKVLLYLSKKYS